MSEKREIHPFIEYLMKIEEREDRASLAHLKRGLGKPPGTVMKMHPYIVPWLSRNRSDDDYYVIASLFAAHPENQTGMDMGKVFKKIWENSGETDSIEKRFMALLDTDRENLPDHLRHAVSLAKSKDVPIDWTKLFRDMKYWNSDERWVQKTWAFSFWKDRERNKENEEEEK